jgi:hypothetical protein
MFHAFMILSYLSYPPCYAVFMPGFSDCTYIPYICVSFDVLNILSGYTMKTHGLEHI